MHPTQLVQRRAKALNRIVETSSALASRLELDPALIEALQPKGAKDPPVIEMMRLEAVADLLQALAISAGAIKEGVTAVTDLEPESKPMDESIPGPVPPSEDLPPPVLEGEGSADQPAEESAAETQAEEATLDEPATETLAPHVPPEGGHAGVEDLPAEESPAEEPTEEEPVDESKPRNGSRKSSRKK